MQNSNRLYTAIYDMGSVAQQFGGAFTITPTPAGTPDRGQTWPLRYPSTNTAAPTVSSNTMMLDNSALISLLTNSAMRNFFYFGHGTPNTIAAELTATQINTNAMHYYRFVFLDACLTANGFLPGAFGIPYNQQLPLSYFEQTGLRPRTFLGYPIVAAYGYAGTFRDSSGNIYPGGQIPDSVPDFLTNFEFYWYYGYDVNTAIQSAIDDNIYIGNNWETGETLRLYGYDSLGVNDYNYASDWQK